MSDETARQRRNREHTEQLIANGAIDDFADDVAADFKAADREIARLTTENTRLTEALRIGREALEEVGGIPGKQVPNCTGGCLRWSLDCDHILTHPQHKVGDGPFRCKGAVARAALAAISKAISP